MIKNLYMKAFSFLLIMLIGMISMTGFGQSTADLKENPKQEQVVMQVTSPDTASVEVMTLYAAYDGVMVTGNTYYTVYRNESGNREVVLYSTQIDPSPPQMARTDHIPRGTYSDPELAQIGLTEGEARAAHGGGLTVIRLELSQNDRAVAQGRKAGLLKLMVVTGRPVGVSITGPQAGELIGFWALPITKGLKLSAITGLVLPYPTLSELSKRAAGAYFSPQLFGNPWVKRVVRLVQRLLP